MLQPVNELVLRNRGEGPLGVLLDIEERLARGESIVDAIDETIVAQFMARYKEAAGTAREALNNAAPIVVKHIR